MKDIIYEFLDYILLERKTITAKELAERFKVSRIVS